jgi:hypothetical protein
MPQMFARLGDKNKAPEGLDRSLDGRTAIGKLVTVNRAFVSLHSDPRFESLLRRMD